MSRNYDVKCLLKSKKNGDGAKDGPNSSPPSYVQFDRVHKMLKLGELAM